MTLVCLSGRSDDRLWETLVLAHSLRQFHTTNLAAALLILTPCGASEDGTDDHLNAESLTLQTHCNHRVGSGEFPVGADVARCVEEFCRNLVENLSLERNAFGQNDVERRDTVGSHHNHKVVVDVVNVAYFSVIYAFLSLEIEIGVS